MEYLLASMYPLQDISVLFSKLAGRSCESRPLSLWLCGIEIRLLTLHNKFSQQASLDVRIPLASRVSVPPPAHDSSHMYFVSRVTAMCDISGEYSSKALMMDSGQLPLGQFTRDIGFSHSPAVVPCSSSTAIYFRDIVSPLSGGRRKRKRKDRDVVVFGTKIPDWIKESKIPNEI